MSRTARNHFASWGSVCMLTLAQGALCSHRAAAAQQQLEFSTYFGGSSADSGRDVVFDGQGNLYVTGGTHSTNFPRTFGPAFNTGSCASIGTQGKSDVYIAKYAPSGQLLWSRLLGGPCYDRAYAIELDGVGNIYVAGRAGEGFPTTAGVVQLTFGGDSTYNPSTSAYGKQDGFVAKLSADGSQVLWATYFGGPDLAVFRDIAVDSAGTVYGVMLGAGVGGSNPHITAGAFQAAPQGSEDMLVAKIASDGRTVLYATYLGGNSTDGFGPSIRINTAGEAYVLGRTISTNIPTTAGAYDRTLNGTSDLYLAKLNTVGTALLFATYLGGSSDEFPGTHNLWVDGAGNAYVAATTYSADFPTTAGAFQRAYRGGASGGYGLQGDSFVAKFSPTGQFLLGTFVGGSKGEGTEGIGVDSTGNIYVSGASPSTDFPVTSGAYQTAMRGIEDGTLYILSADFTQLLYATYLGGSVSDTLRSIAVDAAGNFAATGLIKSSNWPTLNAAQPTFGGVQDSVVVRFAAGSTPLVRGDLDGDGDVDLNDLRRMIYMLVGTVTPDLSKADLDGDRQVALADLQLLVKLLVGIP